MTGVLNHEVFLKAASIFSGFISTAAQNSTVETPQEGTRQYSVSQGQLSIVDGGTDITQEVVEACPPVQGLCPGLDKPGQHPRASGLQEGGSHVGGVMHKVEPTYSGQSEIESGGIGSHEPVVSAEPDHLVVMVHGVSGDPDCFTVLQESMKSRLSDSGMLLVASEANKRVWSHDGVEECGLRLVKEISQYVEEHPSLKRISFVAYSIGGLFARYACGVSYNPSTRTICGLVPCNFMSIATPHLGCHVEGESQVPFIGWGLRVPMMQHVLKPIFDTFAAPVTRMMYGLSGRNLFLEDGGASKKPVVMKLVYDIPEEGFFFSALSQFKSRVCYANAVGDALVGWANASIRKKEELPWKKCNILEYMGVVEEAPLLSGCWGKERQAHGPVDSKLMLPDWDHIRSQDMSPAAMREAVVGPMLSRLQTLPWCRIDVAIKNTFKAHTNIIVVNESLDSIGIPIVEHIAHRFSELDQLTGFQEPIH